MALPRMLLAVGRDSSMSPFYHLIVALVPGIQLTDELSLRRHLLSQCSTKRSSQSNADISGLLRERETAAARPGCHFLPRFHLGDKEMSDTA